MTRLARAFLIVLGALGGACATTPEAPPPTTSRAVPIVFLEAQPHRPFVELRVGESVGWFLLDTGAAGNVMSDWFFQAAFPGRKLEGGRGFAVDFAGVPIPTTVVRDVEVTWADGLRQALTMSVGPFSRVGDADGLAGVISPQRLLGRGEGLELDFLGKTLRWWAHPRRHGAFYSVEDFTLLRCTASTDGAPIFSWATAVDGEPVWAMMDTGSPVTAVSSAHASGQHLLPRSVPLESGRGASNAPLLARAAPAEVVFAGIPWRGHVAVMKLPLVECNTAALIGMNILKRCSVLLTPEWGSVACAP
ncbi:MAG: hypothetical protein AB1938_09475 [Myxococcota bacterium]